MGPLHTGPLLLNKRVSQVVNHHHVKAQWLPSASIFKGEALLLVRDVVSMLTTLRNTMSGSVQRVTGRNDVLYLLRLSAGRCLTESCHDVGLSHHFDRSIFKVDPPPVRAEAIDIVHSVNGLLPEAAALAVQSCLPPGRYSMAAMVATSAVGLVSLSGVGMLAVLEVRGSRFRAAADLDWLEAHLLPDVARAASVNRCLTGVPLACSELMLLASAVGYRPGLLVALAVGCTALYLLVSAAASSTASPIRRRTRLTQAQREQLDPACRSWPVTWREEVVLLVRGDSFPPPAELVAIWALRRGSGHRCLWLLRSTTLVYARGGSSPRADTPSKAPRLTVPWMLEQEAARKAAMYVCTPTENQTTNYVTCLVWLSRGAIKQQLNNPARSLPSAAGCGAQWTPPTFIHPARCEQVTTGVKGRLGRDGMPYHARAIGNIDKEEKKGKRALSATRNGLTTRVAKENDRATSVDGDCVGLKGLLSPPRTRTSHLHSGPYKNSDTPHGGAHAQAAVAHRNGRPRQRAAARGLGGGGTAMWGGVVWQY